MADLTTDAPEIRSERASVMLSVEEKRALRVVAGIDGVTESDALRDNTVAAIMARYHEIRAKSGAA